MLPLALLAPLWFAEPLRLRDAIPIVDAVIEYAGSIPIGRPPANVSPQDVPVLIDLDDLGRLFREFTRDSGELGHRPRRFARSMPWRAQLVCEGSQSDCAAPQLSLLVQFTEIKPTRTDGEYVIGMAMVYIGPRSSPQPTKLLGYFVVTKAPREWKVIRLDRIGVTD